MRVLDLFSGIGGISLACERAGMETVAFCEIEPYCQRILNKHWPNVPIFDDVKLLTRQSLIDKGVVEYEAGTDKFIRGRGIDLICGGFP